MKKISKKKLSLYEQKNTSIVNKKNQETICVQGGYVPQKGEPRVFPIYQSTTFKYDNTEQMADLFDLKANGYFYSRLQNPTCDFVAKKITELEGGTAGMLTSSGQAANFYAIFNICQAGDNFISTQNIYGGTFNLFGVTMKKLGIECRFVDPKYDAEKIEKLIDNKTKCIFIETITNPTCEITDIEKFVQIADNHGIPLVVDNTFATPINFRPIEWGATIVTHSTTKYIDGHALTIGGAIIESGKFDWLKNDEKFPALCTPDESYHGIVYAQKFGQSAYIYKCVAQLMRDLGAMQSPQNAFLINIGLETLHLRVKKHCENAQKVAEYLSKNNKIEWVNYSGLAQNEYHQLAQKYFDEGRSCGVIAFGFGKGKANRDKSIKFMDNLKLISIVTHVADAKSCVLHPASHTHRQLTENQLIEAGITPDLIRLSVGLENADDIINDIQQALDKL